MRKHTDFFDQPGTALFGGSFDPFHNGHLMVVEEVLKLPFIDELILVPAKLSPGKESPKFSEELRLRLVKSLSIPRVKISTLELEREGPSFTIDTVKQLHPRYLVMGSDQFNKISEWKSAAELAQMVGLIVLRRKGEKTSHTLFPNRCFLQNEMIELSSTTIKEKWRRGDDISKLVPEPVFKVLKEIQMTGETKQ